MTSLCRICYSPYRREIEKLLENGVSPKTIGEKYAQIMKVSKLNVITSVKNHQKKKHQNKADIVTGRTASGITTTSLENDYRKAVTFEAVAQSLLTSAGEEIEGGGLKNLSLANKIKLASQAEKVNIEGKRLQLGKDSLKLAMAKFLGGFMKPIEGEVVEPESIEP